MGTRRWQAPLSEGAGHGPMPERDPAHEHVQWFELDLDDELNDPDEPDFDPLPTVRHRRVVPR